MDQGIKKPKMTLEKLATMTQREFAAVRKEMATKADLKNFATKEDLKYFATKEDLRGLKDEIVDEVRKENGRVIQSNDKVISRLDTLLKEDAAHKAAHDRVDEELEDHGKRIKRLETASRLAG